MRAPKPGDSPSGATRDVYPLRQPRRPAREWPTGPLGDAMHAIFVRYQQVQFEQAKAGQPSLLAQDPRDLAVIVERLGNAARLEGMASTFELASVYALAAFVSACRAEELDPTTGGEAA
jgi:hypothetical protein